MQYIGVYVNINNHLIHYVLCKQISIYFTRKDFSHNGLHQVGKALIANVNAI